MVVSLCLSHAHTDPFLPRENAPSTVCGYLRKDTADCAFYTHFFLSFFGQCIEREERETIGEPLSHLRISIGGQEANEKADSLETFVEDLLREAGRNEIPLFPRIKGAI